MKARERILKLENAPWAISIALILYIIYQSSSITIPIACAFCISYILSFAKRRIEKIIKNNTLATILCVSTFFFIFVVLITAILPRAYMEIVSAVNLIEQKLISNNIISQPIFDDLIIRLTESRNDLTLTTDHYENLTKFAKNSVTNFLKIAYKSGKIAISVIKYSIIIPIMTYFLLKDLESIFAFFTKMTPRRALPKLQEISQDIDIILGKYVSGQIKMCTMISVYYLSALYIIGLESFLTIGIISGLISFMPYIGFISSISFCIIITINENIDLLTSVLSIYAFGSILENYILAPRVFGKQINIHPAWIIISVFVSSSVIGIAGIILAIPLASIASVLSKHLISSYLKSNIYRANSLKENNIQ